MSANTVMSIQIQMKKKKKYSIDQKTCPVPNSASCLVMASSVGEQPASERENAPVAVRHRHPARVVGRRSTARLARVGSDGVEHPVRMVHRTDGSQSLRGGGDLTPLR